MDVISKDSGVFKISCAQNHVHNMLKLVVLFSRTGFGFAPSRIHFRPGKLLYAIIVGPWIGLYWVLSWSVKNSFASLETVTLVCTCYRYFQLLLATTFIYDDLRKAISVHSSWDQIQSLERSPSVLVKLFLQLTFLRFCFLQHLALSQFHGTTKCGLETIFSKVMKVWGVLFTLVRKACYIL